MKALAVALVLVLIAVPVAGAAERSAPKRFVGVMWDREIQDAPREVQSRQWAAMAASGVETARVIFSWELAQPEQGKPPSFALTDVMAEEAARHGIELLPVITHTPEWNQVVPHRASAPADVGAYVAYLKALVRRYGPGGSLWVERPGVPKRPIRHWQIWNEPPLDSQFRPHQRWAERYGEILRRSSRTIKKADPAARVVLGGLANDAWAAIDSLYREGGIRGSFDVAAVHMYSAKWKDFMEIVRRFRKALDRNGDRDKSIFVTEVGASASRGAVVAEQQQHFQLTRSEMASLITTAYTRLARLPAPYRLERVYWYTWASPYTPESNVFGYSGLNAYGPQDTRVRPMPALAGFRKMARSLQGCTKDTKGRCTSRRR